MKRLVMKSGIRTKVGGKIKANKERLKIQMKNEIEKNYDK